MTKDPSVISIVGARPNFVKLASICKNFPKRLNHLIIHTGQHYDFEMSEIFFKNFKIPKPNYNLEVGQGTRADQVGKMIQKIEIVLLKENPDLVLVYGDTNSTFAGAFAASTSYIKLAHIESGLRSFDRRMPEETNRILTDNLSDYLFAPTKTSILNLKRENTIGKIIRSGDLSVEILNETKANLLRKKKKNTLVNLDPKSYNLFTMHRAENTAKRDNLLAIIRSFEKLRNHDIVFPIHPRTKKVLESYSLLEKLINCRNVKVIEPVGYPDFIDLLLNSKKVITDSGGVQKEAYILSIPCVTIRENTEWVETVAQGWNVLTGLNTNKIIHYVSNWHPAKKQKPIFGKGNTSKIIKNEIEKLLK
ncbi:MAG: non-hydrolyzing UDP-N-acetylglucosamine 2-epimerase [Candidatus Nitrosocosmicus sp.]